MGTVYVAAIFDANDASTFTDHWVKVFDSREKAEKAVIDVLVNECKNFIEDTGQKRKVKFDDLELEDVSKLHDQFTGCDTVVDITEHEVNA